MTIDRAIEILDPRTFPDVSGDEAVEACRWAVYALHMLKISRCSDFTEPPKEGRNAKTK